MSFPGASQGDMVGGHGSTQRKTGSVALGPRLAVWPLRLDAGYLLVNQVVTQDIEISNRGSGALVGVAETNIAALSVEPSQIDDHVTRITVRIDATGLALGPYVCHVSLRTNGGVQIVQVRFVVRPAGDVLAGRSRPTGI